MGETTRDQKLGLEFQRSEYDEIDKYCSKLGIDWFASAWDIKSLEFLENYRFVKPVIYNIELFNQLVRLKSC